MSEDIDPFKVLNLPEEDVSQAVIDKAFKVLALKYHPDKNPEPNAQEMFQRIHLAKEMLLDPETKAALLRVKRAKRARHEQEQELEGRAREQAQARKRFAEDLDRREKQSMSAHSELQRAQASLASQMRKWHEERLAAKREQLRQQAPTVAAATAAAAASAATEGAESVTRSKTKPVDSETIGLLHKALEVRWSAQHAQHDADSLRNEFEKCGEVVHVSMRGKRRSASTQRKAVVVMASSSAATAAARHGSGIGGNLLVTPLPKVANLGSLPGASPEVLKTAAASLQRAGIRAAASGGSGGGQSQTGTAVGGAGVGAPAANPPFPGGLGAHDALTAVLAAAAAAAAGACGAARGASVTTGTAAATTSTAPSSSKPPPSFPSPTHPRFPAADSNAENSSAQPRSDSAAGAAVPTSFPVAAPMPGTSTQASHTLFRAPANRAASAPSATDLLATPSSAAPSSFPTTPPIDSGGVLEGATGSIDLQSAQAALGSSLEAAAAVAALAAAAAAAAATAAGTDAGAGGGGGDGGGPAAPVPRQLDREKLRAQRLAELEALGSDDDEAQ